MRTSRMKRVWWQVLAFVPLWVPGSLWANPGDLDPGFGRGGRVRFGFGGGASQATAVAVQADGKLVVAGTSRNGRTEDFLVMRFNPDHSLDPEFGNGGVVLTPVGDGSDQARAMRIQADGKIVLVGRSVNVAGTATDVAVVRYLADGRLDPEFSGDGKAFVPLGGGGQGNAVVIQSDGKIVVGAQGTGGMVAIRFNPDGSLDTDFSGDGLASAGGSGANGIALQADGKIVLAGFVASGSFPIFTNKVAVARFLTTGALDPAFAGGALLITNLPFFSEKAETVAMQAAGITIGNPEKIVVAGVGTGEIFVLRYNLDGTLDPTFDGDGIFTRAGSSAREIRFGISVNGPNRIIVAGTGLGSGNSDFLVFRLFLGGTYDTAFDGDGVAMADIGGGNDDAVAMTIQGGRYLVAGSAHNGSNEQVALARFNANGPLDETFDLDGKYTIGLGNLEAVARAVARTAEGKLLVAGWVQQPADIDQDFGLARLNADGTLDPGFDGDGKLTTAIGSGGDRAHDLAIQTADGKIVLAGSSVNGLNQKDFAVVRYDANGVLDPGFDGDGKVVTTFGVGAESEVNAVLVDPVGNTVVAGYALVGGQSDFALARYLPGGGLDPGFDFDGRLTFVMGPGADVARAMVRQSNDGKLVVVGTASNGSNDDLAVARFNSNGMADSSFSFDGRVVLGLGIGLDEAAACAIDQNGKILVAGASFLGADLAMIVLRFTVGGALDPTFDGDGVAVVDLAGRDDRAARIVVQPDGRMVVAGSAGSDYLAVRLLADGSLDSSFGAGGVVVLDDAGSDERGHGLMLDHLGRVVIAGASGGLFEVLRLQSRAVELKITEIRRLETGVVVLEGLGLPGATHTLHSSESATGIGFAPLGPVVPNGAGGWEYEDRETNGVPLRLYRLTLP